ncbi:MAG TPA: carbohydrate ABC transporter substrate-binding protein, partial [Intrasporangium sp.]|nr:carbohydrate ABC transporter substrate-binding protein [Intrasporangium sp.]
MSGNRKRVVLAAGVAVAMTLLAGCLSSENPSGGGGAAGTGGFVDGGSADNDKKVTMLGTFGGDEEKNFLAALAPFEQSSGIDIQYTSDRDFATTIKQKVNSGDAPDIGLFAQPGGLMEFAADNKVQALDSILDVNALNSSLVPGLLDSA